MKELTKAQRKELINVIINVNSLIWHDNPYASRKHVREMFSIVFVALSSSHYINCYDEQDPYRLYISEVILSVYNIPTLKEMDWTIMY